MSAWSSGHETDVVEIAGQTGVRHNVYTSNQLFNGEFSYAFTLGFVGTSTLPVGTQVNSPRSVI